MDCQVIHTQLAWAISQMHAARNRLDNGDTSGVIRALRLVDQSIAAVCKELEKINVD